MRNIESFLKIVMIGVFLVTIFSGCGRRSEVNLATFEPLTDEQSEKVRQALLPLNIPFDTWEIKRVRSSHPLAASFKSYLLLSDGIFSRLASTSELSFILAHEFAHKVLKHELQDKPPLKLEKEADRAALFILIKAKLPPSSAITALSRMLETGIPKANMIEDAPTNDSDLSIIKRIQALNPLIQMSALN